MRRLAPALLAGLVVGGATLVALGLAQSAGLGQSVEAPPRLVGDRALYTVHDGNGTLLGQLRVEALAPFAARGADGSWQAVEALRQTFVPDPATAGAGPATAETAIEPWHAAGGAVVAVRFSGGNETYATWTNRYNDVVVGVDMGAQDPNVFVAPQAVVYGDAPVGQAGWCGLRNSAQGREVAVREGLAAPDCPAGRLEWDGRTDKEVHRFGVGPERVWVAEGWTYPLRVETYREGALRVLELIGFEAGSTPLDLTGVRLPPSGVLPTVALAPRTRTGPDAAGFDHPFPIEAALEEARLAAERPGVAFSDRSLGEFLQAHPDFQVAEAHYSEHTDTEWTLLTWELAVVDGDAWAAGSVSMEQKEPDAGPLAPPAWSTLSPLRGNALVTGDGPSGPWPPQATWPAEMPTVASVIARWEAVRDSPFGGKPPTGWSFRIGCADEACTAPSVEVGGGHVRFQEPPDPLVQGPVGVPQGAPVEADSQELVVDGEGHSLALRSVHRREAPADFSLVAVPGAHGASVAAEPAPAWDVPPAAVATTGALALAALLAVLLWPAIKTGLGGAGLFSRIEDSRLLDHKGRAAIVQAVEAEPGVHLRELARRTGQAEGALRHHLHKLEAAGLVVARPLGGYLCYFAPAAAASAEAAGAASARSEGARKVLAAVQGGATGVREIAAATGLAPSTVSHHLGRLRQAGAARKAPNDVELQGPTR